MPTVGSIAYLTKTKSYRPLRRAHNFTKPPWRRVAFLWGDPVFVISTHNHLAQVSAKGHHIDIPVADLMDTAILRLYQIDVGQGDAIWIQIYVFTRLRFG